MQAARVTILCEEAHLFCSGLQVALPIATFMFFSNISRLCPHNEPEKDDLHCKNEEVSYRPDEGGCLRTHRKPVTEAGN